MKSGFSPARTAAYKILYDVLENKAFSNISVNNNINLNMTNPADRALCVNITYGTLKKYNKLKAAFESLSKLPPNKLDRKTVIIILMALYQMFYLERVPLYAIVNDAVNMARFYVGSSAAGFTNAILRTADKERNNLFKKETEFIPFMNYEYGFPEWVTKLLLGNMSEAAIIKTAAEFEKAPEVTIRVNTTKTTAKILIASLKNEGITAEETYVPDSLIITNGASRNIFRTNAFRDGKFFAQDISGIIAGYALNPQRGEKILDICAAPGAKSFNAAILASDAQVTSCDNNSVKLGLLRQSAGMLGLANIHTSKRDSSAEITESADTVKTYEKIIADVPCSGLGVIGRKPEILMNITPSHIESLKNLQYRLLKNNAARLKSNGVILYSTCTMNSGENEEQVEKFLSENDGFRTEAIKLPFEMLCNHEEAKNGILKLSPDKDRCDGFFIARLKAVR